MAKVASRLPALKKRREMSRADLAVELREAAAAIDERAIRDELAPLLPASEVTDLESRIRAAVVRLAEWLKQS